MPAFKSSETPWVPSMELGWKILGIRKVSISFSSVHSLSHVQLFAIPKTVARQASLFISNSWNLLKLMSITSVMTSNHFILCLPLLLLPLIFPSIKVKVKSLRVVSDSATPWTVAYQACPSMRFSRQEYWIGLPFPSPGDLPNPGIEPGSPTLEADALTSEPPGKPTWLSCFSHVQLCATP